MPCRALGRARSVERALRHVLLPAAIAAAQAVATLVVVAPVVVAPVTVARAAAEPATGAAPPPPVSAPPEGDTDALTRELERELGSSPPAGAAVPAPPADRFVDPLTAVSRAVTAGGVSPAVGPVLVDLSAVFSGTLNYFSDEPTRRESGHEPDSTTDGFNFQLQEIELALQGVVDPFLRADVYLSIGRDEIEVEEAYFTTLALPWNLRARGGQFYAPFGRLNTQHFLETTPFVDAPLVNRHTFSDEQVRGLGFELSWLVPVDWYATLTGAVQTADNEVSFGVDANDMSGVEDFLTTVRLEQSVDLSERWTGVLGLSFLQGPNASGGIETTDDHRTRVAGADLHLRWRDPTSHAYVAWISEVLYRDASFPGGSSRSGGLYSMVDWRIDRSWEAAVRLDLYGLFEDLDGAPDFEGELAETLVPFTQRRIGTSLTYHVSEFHRWRLQYAYDDLRGDDAGLVDARDGVHEVFLQFQWSIGAHGAHPF